MTHKMAKCIYEYMDYREFLRDFYTSKKYQHSFYSYRLFSQKAGFKSPNFLKLVIDGKRNLTKESVFKFSRAIGLNRGESEYFENMVFLNQSRTLEEKNSYLSRLMKFRIKTDPKKIEESEYEYYSRWYNPVIRELATAVDFRDDFRRLASSVVPAISPGEAQKSIELLLKLEFIRRCEDGTYEKTASVLSTGPQVRSVAIGNYHKAMMKLGSDSLERFRASERNISSLTLSVSENTFDTMVARIEQFRKELLDVAESDCDPQKVVQLNLQLFPLTVDFRDAGGEQ